MKIYLRHFKHLQLTQRIILFVIAVVAIASYLCKQLFEIVEHKLRMHSKTGQWCIIPHGAKSFLPK